MCKAAMVLVRRIRTKIVGGVCITRSKTHRQNGLHWLPVIVVVACWALGNGSPSVAETESSTGPVLIAAQNHSAGDSAVPADSEAGRSGERSSSAAADRPPKLNLPGKEPVSTETTANQAADSNDTARASDAEEAQPSGNLPPMLLPLPHQAEEPRRIAGGMDVVVADDLSTAVTSQQLPPLTDNDAPGGQGTAREQHSRVVGHPLAPGIITLLEQEILGAVKKRGIELPFARFKRYLGWKLDSTAAEYTGNEVTGLCRLRWYDHLLRHPESAAGEVERFSRELHTLLQDEQLGPAMAIAMLRLKMDVPEGSMPAAAQVASPEEAIELLKECLELSRRRFQAAIEPLSARQLQQIEYYAYRVFTAQGTNGHTLPNRSTASYMCKAIRKMNADALFGATEALLRLANVNVLRHLAQLSESPAAEPAEEIPGVTGPIHAVYDTEVGKIVVAAAGDNVYELEKAKDVVAVVDLGGDDTYLDGAVSAERPLLVLIDLAGNDKYRGTRPGIQAGALLGVSMLLDLSGNDIYQARDLAQASAIAGAGILIDYAGNDIYAGIRRVQSQALGGLALLVDRAGNDRYHAALWAQGVGAPLGCAVLDDLAGSDHYFVGGLYPDSYEETPGYDGWGQGIGNGLRQVANGGIGVLLDGGGDDVYEFDYMGHGGGYWLGVGVARDFAGNDRRLGATTKTFRGGRRTERRFQRFGCGFGCHYGLGFCFDDQGNDTYGGTIMGLGYGWDCGIGVLCDFGGDDRYDARGGGTQGSSGQASLGILFDYNGRDVYRGTSQGYAPGNISYHQLPACGGNFSFLVDYGGEDQYGCRLRNNTYNQRGAPGGFLIDRPRREELQHIHTAAK